MDKNILSRLGWLSRQPDGFRAAVLAAGQLRRFGRGATIFMTGDDPGGIYGIVHGSVAVTIAPRRTGPHIAQLAPPGAWFGEGCFLTGEPRRVGLEAATDSALFHLPLDAMERLAGSDPVNIRRFAQIAMLNIDLALRVIDDLLIPDADRRIAATLLRALSGDGPGTVHVSQAELGRLSNASRKVVNRALGRLTRLGLLNPRYGAIDIMDPARLRAFASGDPIVAP